MKLYPTCRGGSGSVCAKMQPRGTFGRATGFACVIVTARRCWGAGRAQVAELLWAALRRVPMARMPTIGDGVPAPFRFFSALCGVVVEAAAAAAEAGMAGW